MNILNLEKFSIYLILETSNLKLKLEDFIEQVVDAGVSIIQLRDKNSSENERYHTALKLRKLLENKCCKLIINDNIDIALSVNADGAHLGIKDTPINEVKSKYPNLILGYSCNNLHDVEIANKYADYIGIGPAFKSSTKLDIRKILSIEEIDRLSKKSKIPSFAIGGIDDLNIDDVHNNTSVNGVAVSSYITSTLTPYDTVTRLLR